MHIYLFPPTPFWGIADTDVRLTRAEPLLKITEEEYARLNDNQKRIFQSGLANNVIGKLDEAFIPQKLEDIDNKYILSLPADRIQRAFVSKFVKAKDKVRLQALLTAEEQSANPRKLLVNLLKMSLEIIGKAPLSLEDKFLAEIDFAPDPEPVKPNPSRNTTIRQAQKVTNGS